ncbi:MAG: ATP-dependent Clp protease ATP-binding subunit [Magnetococcus sp. THC-1_WYH]
MKPLAELRRLAEKDRPGAAIGVASLLIAWLDHDPEAVRWLAGRGITVEATRKTLLPCLKNHDLQQDRNLILECMADCHHGQTTAHHLLHTLGKHPDHPLSSILASIGLHCGALPSLAGEELDLSPVALGIKGPESGSAISPLLRHGRDLLAEARDGAFSGHAPRPETEMQLSNLLQRHSKGNVILVGPAGCGKTALVERLAHDMVHHPAHPLARFHFFEISMGRLVAGTQYRGQFEERLEGVIRAASELGQTILFIDEIHLLAGAGRVEGGAMDGANLLKPHLTGTKLRIIGATTEVEYQRYLARDRALTRRFQKIRVDEPEPALIKQMVTSRSLELSRHHGVQFPDAVIERAIELTNRYLPDRVQPDKCVDLLDGTAVRVRQRGGVCLDFDDLLQGLAQMTGQPVAWLAGTDHARLLQLRDVLKRRIIGQDEAVEKVSQTLIKSRLDLGSRERPLATLMFAGPTGVGKTELARTLAAEFLGDSRRIIHLDLAEYSGPGAVYKLIGAPPGLVGYEEEGTLVRGLQAHPQAVVLFDEVEKADPDVRQMLLGLLDNGRITSSRGERLDVRGSVIVLTTNALTARQLAQPGMGFTDNIQGRNLQELLMNHFSPEMLGRIDEIIVFNPLSSKSLRQILSLRLTEMCERLEHRKIVLHFERERLLDHLMSGLVRRDDGARAVSRLLETALLHPLAQSMLLAEPGEELTLSLDEAYYREGRLCRESQIQDGNGVC